MYSGLVSSSLNTLILTKSRLLLSSGFEDIRGGSQTWRDNWLSKTFAVSSLSLFTNGRLRQFYCKTSKAMQNDLSTVEREISSFILVMQTSWIYKQIRTLVRIVLVLRFSVLSFPLMYGNPTKQDFVSWYLDMSGLSPEWVRFLAELGFLAVNLHKMLRIRKTQLLTFLAHVFYMFLKGNCNYEGYEMSYASFSLQAMSCSQYFHSLSLTIIKGNEQKRWKRSLTLCGSSPNLNMAFLTWTHMEHLLPLN